MEAWVTPGRVKVPHLKTVWNPTTMTWSIEETTPNPHDYGTLATTSQAYKNITTGIPTDYNQYSGCPVGHVMGPDGVCRPVTGWQGTTTSDPTDPTIPDPSDPTDPFPPSNQYTGIGSSSQQTDPYKEYMASMGTNKFASTGNDYSALPGGMNNWTDEAFYDWGLDKGYITESGIGGPQESKFPGWLQIPAQYMNDKKFQWWKDSAIERGLIKEHRVSGAAGKVVSELELLKKRGEGEGFGGGGLIDITKDKNVDAESTWNNITADTFDPSTVDDSSMLQKRLNQELAYKTRETATGGTGFYAGQAADKLNAKSEEWWTDVYNKWLTGDYGYQDKDWEDNNFPNELGVVAIDYDIMPAVDFYGRIDPTQTNYFGELNTIRTANGELSPAFKQFKQHVLGNAELYDKEQTGLNIELNEFTTQRFDPLLDGGKWVTDSVGLSQEAKRRAEAKKLLAEQQDDSKIKPKFKPEGMFFIGTSAGDKANNMTKAQTGQYIGASVYKSPDKASNVGGHYQQNGKFVQSDGTVTAGGSMSDSIYAMINGTAVNKVLDRTFKSKGSANVMKKEADKMLKNGKITSEEHKKVTSYKTKDDYQNDKNNKTIHENGTVTTKGSGTTGQSLGPAGSGSAGTSGGGGGHQNAGNTGSGSKKDKIICTEMYRQTNLNDWKEAMKLWYLFQKKHLTPTHQVGYHFLFKPFVRGMKKSKILTAIGSHFAKQRTKDIKHIMFGTKFSLLGRIYRIMFEPICYITGLILTRKEKLAWQ